MTNSHNRHIPFEGCFNFRDLGGYETCDGRAVQWRRLFRSGELHFMTSDDVMQARVNLNIRTIIDLREPQALEVFGKVATLSDEREASCYYNIPLIVEDIEERLRREQAAMLSMTKDYLVRLRQPQYAEGIVQAMRILAEPNALPAVFHCSAGKDRAGLVAAIALGVLGVSNEDIVRDYALSARYLPAQIDHWYRSDPESSPYFQRVPPYKYDSRPETMEAVLHELRHEHGSIRSYAKAFGADDNLFDLMEESLLTAS